MSDKDTWRNFKLEYNSNPIKLTFLKCVIQWVLVYPQSCTLIPEHVISPIRNHIPMSTHPLSLQPLAVTNLISASIHLSLLDI